MIDTRGFIGAIIVTVIGTVIAFYIIEMYKAKIQGAAGHNSAAMD